MLSISAFNLKSSIWLMVKNKSWLWLQLVLSECLRKQDMNVVKACLAVRQRHYY